MQILERDIEIKPGDIVTGTLGAHVALRLGIALEDGECMCQQWLWTPTTARDVASSLCEMADLADAARMEGEE